MKKRLQKKVITRCQRNAQNWLDYYNSCGDSSEDMASHHAIKTLWRLDFLLENHQIKEAVAMAKDEWHRTMHPAPHPIATKLAEAKFHSHQQVLEDRELEAHGFAKPNHPDDDNLPF